MKIFFGLEFGMSSIEIHLKEIEILFNLTVEYTQRT